MTRLPGLSHIFDFFIFKGIAAQGIFIIGSGSEGEVTEGPWTDKTKNRKERFRSQSLNHFERTVSLCNRIVELQVRISMK